MPGVMSQMVTERPNAGAVRHQDRRGVLRRPKGGGFVPIVAHGITLQSKSPQGLRNVRTELARVLLTGVCSLGRLCCGLLALLARNGKQQLGLSVNPLAPFLRRS